MDFRPGDYRVVEPREQGIGGWVLIGLFLAALAAIICAYQFRPQWVTYAYNLVGISRKVIAAEDLGPLYQKYGMAPLDTSLVDDRRVNSLLANLQKEPCDRRAIFQAALALENIRATRESAQILKGFADACPEGSGERYRASELYYLLGDYEAAVQLSSDLIDRQPDLPRPYFIRAKSEEGLKRYAARSKTMPP